MAKSKKSEQADVEPVIENRKSRFDYHIGETLDIANAVLYLASDESKFMTGAELKLDGGISAM
jgi:NAD(P)-dependent dehydrogenase (short-subunit alcohol dehydrogenase family)